MNSYKKNNVNKELIKKLYGHNQNFPKNWQINNTYVIMDLLINKNLNYKIALIYLEIDYLY